MEEGHTKISSEPGQRAGYRRLTGAHFGRGYRVFSVSQSTMNQRSA